MQAKAKLRLVKPRSLASVAQEEIEQRIVSGVLRPGARINENSLAAELGISRGPIREACRALAEMGLLQFIVNRGCFVREVTEKDAIDVYDLRASLMRLAGETLALRITDDQIDVLSEMVERMTNAAAKADFESYYELNREFHDRIIEFADNTRLRSICDGLSKELHLYRRQSLSVGFAESDREHRQILAALVARDPERAGGALAAHIQKGKTRFLTATAKGESEAKPEAITGAKL
ncbi:MAG: hypothetical protein CMM48_13695 [Rhodospirillaceae bacterium]|nr:hypothetical protein [Rhodospirillaceae bacterium]HAA91094.1 hypothetical protein [Rhodospirillaceae bacterium]|tara:strand:+ start:293 stop:1000 length:708 start_codon:yes stop_codon:yes gene_type:complete